MNIEKAVKEVELYEVPEQHKPHLYYMLGRLHSIKHTEGILQELRTHLNHHYQLKDQVSFIYEGGIHEISSDYKSCKDSVY